MTRICRDFVSHQIARLALDCLECLVRERGLAGPDVNDALATLRLLASRLARLSAQRERRAEFDARRAA